MLDDVSMSDHHVPLPGSARTAPTGAQHVREVEPNEPVEFTVVLRRRADLPRELVEGPDTVTSTELGDRFGADPADIRAARAAFESAGVTITAEHSASRRLTGHGPASAVSALFGTTLNVVRSRDPFSGNEIEHRSRRGQLEVPAELDGVVLAVLGLDSRPQVRPYVRAHADPAAQAGFDVPTLGTVYNFPANTDGTGHTAAIVEFGGGFAQADLDAYFASVNIPSPKVSSVGVDGATNVPGKDPNGADGEVLMDIEVLGALAPKASVVVYFGPNTDQGFVDTLSTAVHATPTPTVLSISWGQSEDQWTAQARSAMDAVFADAAALGVTVAAASGDNGSQDAQTDNAQHVDYPASSPNVLGCGGTSLVLNTGGAVASETVWNDGTNGGATGGGVSDVYPVPAWQAKAGVPNRVGGTTSGRGAPDVSGDADPATGYRLRVDGQQTVLGGTSAVAPLWSALVCRLAQVLGKSLGLLQPVLYASTTAGAPTAGFRDITQGGNGAYQAGPGWDACTGLGVPDGTALLGVFKAAGTPTGTGTTPAQPTGTSAGNPPK